MLSLGLAFIFSSAMAMAEEEIQRITLKPGARIVIEPFVKTEIVAEAQKGCTLTKTKVVHEGREETVFAILNPNGTLIYYVEPIYSQDSQLQWILGTLKQLKAAGVCGE